MIIIHQMIGRSLPVASCNVHDGKASMSFLRELWPQLADLPIPNRSLRFRMDGAFFRKDVLGWLAWHEDTRLARLA